MEVLLDFLFELAQITKANLVEYGTTKPLIKEKILKEQEVIYES
jgi:hypothetical protein